MKLRGTAIIGAVLVFASSVLAQNFGLSAEITVSQDRRPAVVEALIHKARKITLSGNTLQVSLPDATNLTAFKREVDRLSGVKALRVFPPRLERRNQKGWLNHWDKLEPVYKKRHAEYLLTLTPEEAKRARPEAQGLDFAGARYHYLVRRGMLGREDEIRKYMRNAIEQKAQMPGDDGVAGTWRETGPSAATSDVGPSGLGNQVVTGRFNCVQYSPSDPNIVYAGASGGGLWKSMDSGDTWEPMTDGLQSLNIASIAIDPANPNIVYIGTGDWSNFYSNDQGVFKSIDGGNSWVRLATTASFPVVRDIILYPGLPGILHVNADGALYRSSNSGATWTQVATSCESIAIGLPVLGVRPIYYLAFNGTVNKSTNLGVSFTPISFSSLLNGYTQLTASKIDENRLFAINGLSRKLARSNDGGVTWTDITYNLTSSGDWAQADGYNLSIGAGTTFNVVSGTRDLVYAGMLDRFRLVGSGGVTWTPVGDVYETTSNFHTDQHGIGFHPTTPNIAIIANDGGLYRVTYNGTFGTTTIESLNASIRTFQYYGADFHPTLKWNYMAGAQDNGTVVLTGYNSTPKIEVGGDGGVPVLRQTNTAQRLASTQRMSSNSSGVFNFWRSNNSGATFVESGFGAADPGEFPFIAEVASDPTNTNLVYTGGKFVYRYRFDTDSWENKLGGVEMASSADFHRIGALAIAPTNSARLYAARSSKLSTSSNSGSTWSEVTATAPLSSDIIISSIDVSPTASLSVLVTSGSFTMPGVWECTNTVSPSWVNRTGNLPAAPVNDIERDPSSPLDTWWVATDIGVFRTENRGVTWTNFGGSELPTVAVSRVKYNATTKNLNAVTYGRGIWRFGELLSDPVTGITGFGRFQSGNALALLSAEGVTYQLRPYLNSRPGRTFEAGVVRADFSTTIDVQDPSYISFAVRFAQPNPYATTKLMVFNVFTGKYEVVRTWSGAIPMSTFIQQFGTGSTSLADYTSSANLVRARLVVEPINQKGIRDYLFEFDYAYLVYES